MPGLARETTAKGRQLFEYLRIEARADGIYYVAQPGGRSPTEFRLVDSGTHRARFTNPAHDFPRGIEYTREGNTLRAHLDGVEGGVARTLDYSYRLKSGELEGGEEQGRRHDEHRA